MASSSSSAASHGAFVCCMCGDHGLPGELFRCRCCRARLQHRYCSEQYPRAAAYRRCNWCLRLPPAAAADQGGRAVAVAAASDNKPEEIKRKTTTTASASDEERRRQRHEVSTSSSSRRSPPADGLGHPVKKRHRAAVEKKTPQPQPQPAAAVAVAAGKEKVIVVTSNGAGGGSGSSKDKEEVMRAGKARVNSRVRVRRYKLLTEVISC